MSLGVSLGALVGAVFGGLSWWAVPVSAIAAYAVGFAFHGLRKSLRGG